MYTEILNEMLSIISGLAVFQGLTFVAILVILGIFIINEIKRRD